MVSSSFRTRVHRRYLRADCGNRPVFAHRADRHDPMVGAQTASVPGRTKDRRPHQHPLARRNPASLQGASAADQDLEGIDRPLVCPENTVPFAVCTGTGPSTAAVCASMNSARSICSHATATATKARANVSQRLRATYNRKGGIRHFLAYYDLETDRLYGRFTNTRRPRTFCRFCDGSGHATRVRRNCISSWITTVRTSRTTVLAWAKRPQRPHLLDADAMAPGSTASSASSRP